MGFLRAHFWWSRPPGIKSETVWDLIERLASGGEMLSAAIIFRLPRRLALPENDLLSHALPRRCGRDLPGRVMFGRPLKVGESDGRW